MVGLVFFLIIVAILVYLILRFIKKFVSIIISFIVLFILINSMFLFLVYVDYRDFKIGISEKDSIILVSDGQNYIAGGYVNLTSTSILNTTKYIEDIDSINTKEYKEILGNNYKLFIIDLAFYEQNIPTSINYNNHNLQKNRVLNILRSQDPKQEYATLINEPLESITEKPNELKIGLAIEALDYLMKNKGNIVVIEGYKSKQIKVYRDTMLFKLVKILPNTYIKRYIVN